ITNPRTHPGEGFNESILGTGFWFLGEEVHSPVDIRQDEADRFDNRIDVLTKTFLGLTVSCARCHDHKFDAISTRSSYALYGFLKRSSYRQARFDTMEAHARIARKLMELRRRSRRPIQRALADAVRPGVERLADYLLAAREAIQAGPEYATGREPAGTASFTPKYRQRLEKIARARKLDAALLTRWTAYLIGAARARNDPFHACAKLAADPAGKEARRVREALRPILEAGRTRTTEAANSLKAAAVVIDYARNKPKDWLPDGVAFGPRAVKPGEVRLGNDAASPLVDFYERAAAEKDPTWNGLRPAPGVENDPGAVGAVGRAGRSLRTPTFKLTTGKLFYLVKGNGRAYAAVDAHVLIAGP